MAVADCVAEGTIPPAEADDLFISVGVFIHWEAADDKKIQEYNYRGPRTRSSAPSRRADAGGSRVAAQHSQAPLRP